jgi:hypothetical protein
MKPTSGREYGYTPNTPPDDPAQLKRYLQDELARIAQTLQAQSDGQLEVSTVEPTKPRRGYYRYADGTMWNPGNGEGMYRFDGTAWIFLG